MIRVLASGLLATLFFLEAYAGNPGVKKSQSVLAPVKLETNAVKMRRAAQKESQQITNQRLQVNQSNTNKNGLKGSNTLSTSAIDYIDLGVSINPFGSFLNGRNYVAVNPSLNTISLFRRGYQTDPNTHGGNNGNKLFFDVSTDGGQNWSKGQGPLYTHTIYDTSVNNFGARYPQGVIWNPAGNSDPNEAIAFGNPRILDGTNDAWGGLGKGWRKIGPLATAKQSLWESPDPLHFRTESMEVTSNGTVFMIEPEEDLSGGGVVFTDKFMVYKYTYNSVENSFDSTISYLPFPNEGGDYTTAIASTAIAFGPDGQTGFIAVGAFNNAYDSTGAYAPYLAKTSDGGTTWTDFKLVSLNHRYTNYDSPDMDALRDSLFVGNYVHFTEAGEIIRAERGDEYSHKVDYTINDIDLVVDQYGYGHLLTNVSVCGFGDTLASDPVSGLTYYPGYGSWNVDLFLRNMEDTASGFLISRNNALNGCWGDCGTDESVSEGNRPQTCRSEDGSILAFCWFDTDLEAHPQLTADENSNPDMWIQRIKVVGPGVYKMNSTPRNMTKGSDNDGLIIQGSVAPLMLNAPTGYKIAATAVNLPPLGGGTTAVWPTQHFFVNQLDVPIATDSFPQDVIPKRYILGSNPLLSQVRSGDDLKIVPNPSTGAFLAQVNVKMSGLAQIDLVNSIGKKVSQFSNQLPSGNSKIPFNINGLRSGIYFLHIRLENSVLSQRIVIE